MVTAIVGPGTDEATWDRWLTTHPLPGFDLWTGDSDRGGPPLVVSPHPDDEVLGVGGLLATIGRAELVAVTDGEASHPGSTVFGPGELATRRRDETVAALGHLGLAGARIHRLGQPDGAVNEAAVADSLTELLHPGQWCLATWAGDGHPDHEAVGRAARIACARTGARLLEYPVWTWHWARPGDPRVPWHRAGAVSLSGPARRAKAAAVREFQSQIEPIGPAPADRAVLAPSVLLRFARPFEVLFG